MEQIAEGAKMNLDNNYITAQQFANLCNVSVRTIRRWAKNGTAPTPLRVGRQILRFRSSDVKRWLEEKHLEQTMPLSNNTPLVKHDLSSDTRKAANKFYDNVKEPA